MRSWEMKKDSLGIAATGMPGAARNHGHPDAHDIGLAMLQHRNEAVVRRGLVVLVQPMME